MTQDKAVQQQRDRKLVQYTASLERMGELVDFVAVAAAVDEACRRPDRSSKGGRPPYPTLVMVNVLFLQALYNLSRRTTRRANRVKPFFFRQSRTGFLGQVRRS